MLSAARGAEGCDDLVKAFHGLTNTLLPFLEKAADRSDTHNGHFLLFPTN